MKCEICTKGIATTFLGKVKGTYVKDGKGKLRVVCFECQKNIGDKAQLVIKLGK
ncbi:hypothetical protein HYU20_01750 [Candidatus Woesearchaeota archaeon]|nr:hypothetical protein [Candidatus Woesearchaeota archaeon]